MFVKCVIVYNNLKLASFYVINLLTLVEIIAHILQVRTLSKNNELPRVTG